MLVPADEHSVPNNEVWLNGAAAAEGLIAILGSRHATIL